MPSTSDAAAAATGSSSCWFRSFLFGGDGSAASPTTVATSSTIPTTAAAAVTTALAPWKRNVLIASVVLLVLSLTFLYLIHNHRGIQRIYQFWSNVTPWIVEYKWMKFKANRIQRLNEVELTEKMAAFHAKTAPKAVALVQQMGGIYVKLGQILSTMAVGILQDDYVQALRPLQDGIPPRPKEEMAKIFHQSTGQHLDNVFESFDEKPIGAASIAQAHRAVLRKKHQEGDKSSVKDDVVIVKIQYPEVAELFDADLNNMEWVTRLLIPGSMDMMKALRERHSRELDFREEAAHLQECAANAQRHKVEPQLVRIPKVRNETGLCTDQVLVMEFLEGTSLHTAIEQEQDRMARALGKRNGQELREFVLERIGEHLEQTHANATNVGWQSPHGNGRLERLASSNVGAGLFRAYVGARDKLDRLKDGLLGIVVPGRSRDRSKGRARPIHMGRILKTLVHVHGLQLLKDGVYNADPHPGNVLVLPDGRLGLLDYGMVGRVTTNQRQQMAETILALSRHDKQAVSNIYQTAGYRATWKQGNVYNDDDPTLVWRFATFHFDKFDLSPVTLMTAQNGTTTASSTHHHHHNNKKQTWKMLDILQTTQEWSVPDWVEQGRRLTGLLAGVSLQAGRPVSMAKEWGRIAEQVLREVEDDK